MKKTKPQTKVTEIMCMALAATFPLELTVNGALCLCLCTRKVLTSNGRSGSRNKNEGKISRLEGVVALRAVIRGFHAFYAHCR